MNPEHSLPARRAASPHFAASRTLASIRTVVEVLTVAGSNGWLACDMQRRFRVRRAFAELRDPFAIQDEFEKLVEGFINR